MRQAVRFTFAFLMMTVAACGDDAAGDPDAAAPAPDAAAPAPDAAAPDAAVPPDGAATPDAPPPPDAGVDAGVATGALRFVHAAPAEAPFDVYLEGGSAALFTAVRYGLGSAYAAVPVGSYQIVLRAAGSAADSAALFTSETVEVAAQSSTTAVGAGLVAGTTPDNRFRITAYADHFGAAAAGTTRVRFVHGSYTLPTVDVDVGDDGTAEAPALARYGSSDEAGATVPSGHDLAIGLIGVDPSHTKQGAFVVPAAALADGGSAYVVATGLGNVRPRDPRGLVLLVVPATGAVQEVRLNPTVYLLAASPDAGALDGYVGGVKAYDNLAFGKIALRRLSPTPTGHSIALVATGGSSKTPLATLATGPLEPGQHYLAIVRGLATTTEPADALSLLMIRDELPVALDGNGRLRYINASLGAPRIDVGRFTAGASPTWVDIAAFAGIVSGAASPAAGSAMLDGTTPVPINPGVRLAGDTATSLRFGSGAMMNTDRWIGVFAGAWAPVSGQKPPRVILVKTAVTAWTATALSPL